jgi:hypothetical protein
MIRRQASQSVISLQLAPLMTPNFSPLAPARMLLLNVTTVVPVMALSQARL